MFSLLRLILGGGLVFATACAKERTTVNLRSVLDEAAENELLPTARLAEKDLVIEGVVVRTGMKDQYFGKEAAYAVAPGVIKGQSERVLTQVPFAVIEPGDGKSGRCMCWFETNEIEKLASYKPKSTIRVYAQLQRFLRQGDHEVLAADCRLVE